MNGVRAAPPPYPRRRQLMLQTSTSAVLIAVGVFLASFLSIPIPPAKVFPGQHIINAVAGVLVGPLWAAVIGFGVGLIRNALGLGTIFAFPGGIPGGMVVGSVYWVLRRLLGEDRRRWILVASALSEPLGTVAIGATISALYVAPLIGSGATLGFFWWSFALSSIPGSIVGSLVLLALDLAGVIEIYAAPAKPSARETNTNRG